MSITVEGKYKAMQEDLAARAATGKLGSLTLSDFHSICDCGKELIKKGVVSTFIASVAEYFRRFGFLVTMDFDNVNYVIVEA